MELVADKAAAASGPLHSRETNLETEGFDLTENGKDTSRCNCKSDIINIAMNTDHLTSYFLRSCVDFSFFFSLVKDMASLERNAHNGLLPERERIKSHTSLHPQTEKKDVSPLGNLCGSCPNQEKVARLSFYTSYKPQAQSYLSSCAYSNIFSLLFFFFFCGSSGSACVPCPTGEDVLEDMD